MGVRSVPTSGTAAYLREARRIRAQKHLSPAARQAALRKLAPRVAAMPAREAASDRGVRRVASGVGHGVGNGVGGWVGPGPAILSISPSVAAAFSSEVGTRITGGILRYTARRQLLARAARLGIPAFEANLLIASVLHGSRPSAVPIAERRISMGCVVGTVITLLAMLAVALWA